MTDHPPTWVLLRGLMRDERHWGAFPAVFAAAFPGVRIETVDFPGNGRLNHQPSPRSVAAMADHVRAELIRRGLAPPYRVLAMSLGAMAATAWTAAHPDEIAAGVLVNTSLRPFSPPHWRLRPRAWGPLLHLLLGRAAAGDIEAAILRLTSHRAPAEVLPDWTAWRLSHPVSPANALRQLAAAAAYVAPCRAPPVPLLVLNGAADALVDPRCSARLAAAWNLPLRVHPQAGHDLPLDDGAWVAQMVRDWTEAALSPTAATPAPRASPR
jgi:pimeloyl-ACP methyl ester carboxylesterase